MEVSSDAVRQTFQSKADTELLELTASAEGLTSEARLLLLQELQNRLAKAKETPETVQLVHGWYTVVAPTTGIQFPPSCPRCCRSEASSSLRFGSPERRRFHRFWWKTTSVASSVPHCSECAAELKRSRVIWSSVGGMFGILWLAVVVWFQVPRFISYIGFFMIALPVGYFYDRTSAVKLGDHEGGVVEYRFRSHEYAKAFAILNHVQAENAETMQTDIEEAISRLR